MKSRTDFDINLRQALNNELRHYPNVIAYGYGVKIKNGQVTQEPCLSIFVSSKRPSHLLKGAEVIPTQLKHKRTRYLTDVIEMGQFRHQSAPQGYPFGECLSDMVRNGTRSAYVSTRNGIMALTCSHVINGSDGNPLTPAVINSYDWVTNLWKQFGVSDRAIYEAGAGTALDFGYLDAALVKVLPQVLSTLQVPQVPKDFFQPSNVSSITGLIGSHVTGFGIASGTCQGIIHSVLVSNIDSGRFAADLVIAANHSAGLTREGDSGMLWQDINGRIIGQHALGESAPPGQGSRLTIGTFIHRIREKLQISEFFALP